MALPILYSAKRIEQQFHTGEEPVLVMCSDVNTYVCKYMRSSAAAYKLVCELVGARMAKAWNVPQGIIKEKIDQLFDDKWTEEVWNNFKECLIENINNE